MPFTELQVQEKTDRVLRTMTGVFSEKECVFSVNIKNKDVCPFRNFHL